jgi:hypothetical protein
MLNPRRFHGSMVLRNAGGFRLAYSPQMGRVVIFQSCCEEARSVSTPAMLFPETRKFKMFGPQILAMGMSPCENPVKFIAPWNKLSKTISPPIRIAAWPTEEGERHERRPPFGQAC